MKHLIAAVALLFATPAAAQGQQWVYQPDGDEECFAMSIQNQVGMGFQAPAADRKGGFLVFAPLGALDGASGDAFVSFAAPGPMGGQHPIQVIPDDKTTTLMLPIDRFGDLDQFPDRFRVRIWQGSKVLIDTEITGFKPALANVRKCMAAR